ncbi:hypothetical protein TNCV_388931 [Trichonephila clavipes]|nr:hypothetical protein TNCV_388931 [Trichonephila clavipes]
MSQISKRLCLVLNPGLFWGQMITVYGCGGALQDDARPHTARVAQDFLRHFQTLPWPVRSPDLSPVEHVWDQLKRQMLSCHSVHDLELAVQDLWAHLPQNNIRCLINSMPDRVAACIAAGGVQRAIEVAQYLCRCAPCIRLIVLFLRSSESLICVIMCIKFHFNPMLSSSVAIFNVPECIYVAHPEYRLATLIAEPLGLGSNLGQGMDVCKCIVPSRQVATLNSLRAASPLVRLVGGEGRPLTTPGCSPSKLGLKRPNSSVTCMVFKAMANDRRHLALCYA